MATDPIPEDLLAAQRRFDEAHAAVKAAAREGAPQDKVDQLREVRRKAVLDLHRARAGTAWEAWPAQKELREAARGDGSAGLRI